VAAVARNAIAASLLPPVKSKFMKTLSHRIFLLSALVLPLVLLRGAEVEKKPTHVISVSPDRADALYRRGETVTFRVKVEHEGKALEQGEVSWVLTKDGVEPRRTGRVALSGGSATITGTLDEPGFLQCAVTYELGATKVTGLGGAGLSPLEIKPSMPAPDDFAAFWNEKKKKLAAIPVNARLTPVTSSSKDVSAFDLQADSLGAPVSGYFARPAEAKPRSLPAILTVHGAGVTSSQLNGAVSWAKQGALALDINAHGLPNGRDKSFYDGLAAGELKEYRRAGRESRETIYFLGMFLRLVRAIDFLTAQPEWDGRTLVVSGSSQGGAQAIAAAGLDARVSYFVAGVPALCDHTGSVIGRINGWPKFIATNEKSPPPNVVEAVRYFDGVNFAARAKAPGFFTVGFIDVTCPPTSVYAAYNALPTKKEIFNDITSGHTNTPAARDAMRAAVVRHFEAMRRGGGAN
jgi:cephalosporin-C deacetylase